MKFLDSERKGLTGKLVCILVGLLATSSVGAKNCEYVKGEFADYFRCTAGEQNVEVVSFSTQSGTEILCIYQLQDFRAPKLKAITMIQDGLKQDDTCGRIGSYCDSCKRNCDEALKAKL